MICHKNVLEVGSFRGSYKLSRRRNPSPLRKRHFLGNSISRIGVKFRTFSFDRLAAHSNLIELPERRKRFARFTSGVHITIVFRGISATAGDWGCFCIWFRFHSCWGGRGRMGQQQSKDELLYNQVNYGNTEGIKGLRRDGASLEVIFSSSSSGFVISHVLWVERLNSSYGVYVIAVDYHVKINIYISLWLCCQ